MNAITGPASMLLLPSIWRRYHCPLVSPSRSRLGAPTVPAVSTIHRVLQRNSLITLRTKRRSVPEWRRFERFAPNDLW